MSHINYKLYTVRAKKTKKKQEELRNTQCVLFRIHRSISIHCADGREITQSPHAHSCGLYGLRIITKYASFMRYCLFCPAYFCTFVVHQSWIKAQPKPWCWLNLLQCVFVWELIQHWKNSGNTADVRFSLNQVPVENWMDSGNTVGVHLAVDHPDLRNYSQ